MRNSALALLVVFATGMSASAARLTAVSESGSASVACGVEMSKDSKVDGITQATVQTEKAEKKKNKTTKKKDKKKGKKSGKCCCSKSEKSCCSSSEKCSCSSGKESSEKK